MCLHLKRVDRFQPCLFCHQSLSLYWWCWCRRLFRFHKPFKFLAGEADAEQRVGRWFRCYVGISRTNNVSSRSLLACEVQKQELFALVPGVNTARDTQNEQDVPVRDGHRVVYNYERRIRSTLRRSAYICTTPYHVGTHDWSSRCITIFQIRGAKRGILNSGIA